MTKQGEALSTLHERLSHAAQSSICRVLPGRGLVVHISRLVAKGSKTSPQFLHHGKPALVKEFEKRLDRERERESEREFVCWEQSEPNCFVDNTLCLYRGPKPRLMQG